MRLFLGGTCNDSKWRDELMPKLDIAGIDYFNPVVKDWNAEAQKNEEREKRECTNHVYVITPEMRGVFSVAEMVESSIQNQGITYICMLHEYGGKKFDESQWHSLGAVSGLASKYNANICRDLGDLVTLLNSSAS